VYRIVNSARSSSPAKNKEGDIEVLVLSCLERSFRKEKEGFHIFLLDSKGAAGIPGIFSPLSHISRKPIKTSALNNE
jgi:hypothetical protein